MKIIAAKGLIAYSAATLPFEFIQYLLLSLITAVGIQESASNPALISFVFISMPLCWFLTFKQNLGIEGIFYGLAIGQAVLCVFYTYIVVNIDWEHQVKLIEEEEQNMIDEIKSHTKSGSSIIQSNKLSSNKNKGPILNEFSKFRNPPLITITLDESDNEDGECETLLDKKEDGSSADREKGEMRKEM